MVEERLKLKGMSPADIELALDRIQIETLGGAAWTFPKGPRIRQFVNEFDPIGMFLGAGLERSDGQEIVRNRRIQMPSQQLPPLKQPVLFGARAMDGTVHGLGDVYADALACYRPPSGANAAVNMTDALRPPQVVGVVRR